MRKYSWLLFSLLLMSVSGCFWDDDDDGAHITEIQISAKQTQIPVGIVTELGVVAYASDGSTQNVNGLAVWSSLSPDVASVDSIGKVQGLAPGSAIIQASYLGLIDEVTITVTDAELTSIEILPPNPSTPLGINVQYSATGSYTDQTKHDISLHPDLAWDSTVPEVATIDQSTALAIPHAVGETYFTASMGAIISRASSLLVRDATVSTIVVTPASSELPLGVVQEFRATATYSDGVQGDITDQLNWISSNTSVMGVVPGVRNIFQAVDQGTALISAELGGVGSGDNSASVTVVHKELSHVGVTAGPDSDNDTNSMPLGLHLQFTATAVFTDDSEYDITDNGQVYWQSSDTNRATVSEDGLVHARALGDVTISVKRKLQSGDPVATAASKTVTITPAELVDIRVEPLNNPSPLESLLSTGFSLQYQAIGVYTDETEVNVSDHELLTWRTWSNFFPDPENTAITQGGLLTHTKASGSESYANIAASIGDLEGSITLVYLPSAQVLHPTGGDELNLDFVGALTTDQADVIGLTYQGSYQSYATLTFSGAEEYCDNLLYNGFNDWRLPSIDELKTLYNYYSDDFTSQHWAIENFYWSSTEYGPGKHWEISLEIDYSLQADDSGHNYVSCVRSTN